MWVKWNMGMGRPAKPRVDRIGYPPRGMRADNAAIYLGMSEASFFRLVQDGLMPSGIPVRGMMLWDRYDLDAAFENLKDKKRRPRNSADEALGINRDGDETEGEED
jgi:predicted DNA-binding transcriptional regulator AlpA